MSETIFHAYWQHSTFCLRNADDVVTVQSIDNVNCPECLEFLVGNRFIAKERLEQAQPGAPQ